MADKNTVIDTILILGSAILLGLALHAIFVIAPDEKTMGAIQRIFYFHVGSAMACYLAIGILFVSSIMYLATCRRHFDLLASAAGEIGFLFCTIVLVSGMIWGHTAWNVWFRFEPRLVSFLLMWFLFLSFVLLRVFGEPGKIATHSAVLGIVGTLTVPLMIYSIKLLPAAAQLHPQVIEHRGLTDVRYTQTLLLSIAALSAFCICLVRLRFRLEKLVSIKEQHARNT